MSNNNRFDPTQPEAFFETLGLRDMTDQEAFQQLQSVMSLQQLQDMAEHRETALTTGDWKAFYGVLYSHPELFTAEVSQDVPRMLEVAGLLRDLEVPTPARVLDVGGGPGHLAFWMGQVWEGSQVTVVDTHGQALGEHWKAQFGFQQVDFVKGDWKDPASLPRGPFDVAVLSAVLAAHGNFPAFQEEGFQSLEPFGTELSDADLQQMQGFRKLLSHFDPLMDPDGAVVLIEPWRPKAAFLFAHALEGTGWGLDFERSRPFLFPNHVCSSLVVKKGLECKPEPALAAAAGVYMTAEPHELWGYAAEALYNTFNVTVQGKLALTYWDGHTMWIETFATPEFVGIYEKATTGYRRIRWGSVFMPSFFDDAFADYQKQVADGVPVTHQENLEDHFPTFRRPFFPF